MKIKIKFMKILKIKRMIIQIILLKKNCYLRKTLIYPKKIIKKMKKIMIYLKKIKKNLYMKIIILNLEKQIKMKKKQRRIII